MFPSSTGFHATDSEFATESSLRVVSAAATTVASAPPYPGTDAVLNAFEEGFADAARIAKAEDGVNVDPESARLLLYVLHGIANLLREHGELSFEIQATPDGTAAVVIDNERNRKRLILEAHARWQQREIFPLGSMLPVPSPYFVVTGSPNPFMQPGAMTGPEGDLRAILIDKSVEHVSIPIGLVQGALPLTRQIDWLVG